MADHISSLSSRAQTCHGEVIHSNKAAVSLPVRTLYLWASTEETRQPRRSPCSFRWTPCDERSGKQCFSTLVDSQLLGNFQTHL